MNRESRIRLAQARKGCNAIFSPISRFALQVVAFLYGILLATNSQFLVSEKISPLPVTNAPCAKVSPCS